MNINVYNICSYELRIFNRYVQTFEVCMLLHIHIYMYTVYNLLSLITLKLQPVLVLYCTIYSKLTNHFFVVESKIAFLFNIARRLMSDLTKHRLSGDEIPAINDPHKKTKCVFDF
jgi:hypothetical protein